MAFISLILVLTFLSKAIGQHYFLSVGDWGGAAIDAQYSANAYAVSASMDTYATAYNVQFIIGTGDNFYYCGIQNTTDSQVNADFVNVYSAASLQKTWYQSLGNHEYGYNVEAQMQYSLLNNLWYLPARYYTKRINLSGNNYMTLIVLDTSPCIADYRQDDSKYWDPCSTEYPTCSHVSNDDDFEGNCKFHENILGQDCNVQYQWFKTTLATVPKEDWLVVVGHHPLYEVNVLDYVSLLQQHGFALYLNGHTHLLNRYTIDGSGAYITTGAGSMVDTYDQVSDLLTQAVKDESKDHQIPSDIWQKYHAKGNSSSGSHSHQTLFTQQVAGFTLHNFNSDFSQLTTQFINADGTKIYSFIVDQQGKEIV